MFDDMSAAALVEDRKLFSSMAGVQQLVGNTERGLVVKPSDGGKKGGGKKGGKGKGKDGDGGKGKGKGGKDNKGADGSAGNPNNINVPAQAGPGPVRERERLGDR